MDLLEGIEPITTDAYSVLTNFSLRKCEVCGKMVMGFDRESHAFEAHRGKKVE